MAIASQQSEGLTSIEFGGSCVFDHEFLFVKPRELVLQKGAGKNLRISNIFITLSFYYAKL